MCMYDPDPAASVINWTPESGSERNIYGSTTLIKSNSVKRQIFSFGMNVYYSSILGQAESRC